MTNDTTKTEGLVVRQEPSIMQIVEQLASRPDLLGPQVDAMEKLLAMKERAEDRQAKSMYADAMAELQAELPPIGKHGEIIVKGVLRSKYALIEDIDEIVKPLMAKYGFSYSQSIVAVADGMRQYEGKLLHRGGHSETRTVFLPLDKSDFRSLVQSEGSTNSYAKRQLYKAHFNFTEVGIDDDGSGQGVEGISDDEYKDLNAKLDETKVNIPKFCEYFDIAKVSDLRKSDLSRAYEMIERKKK